MFSRRMMLPCHAGRPIGPKVALAGDFTAAIARARDAVFVTRNVGACARGSDREVEAS